MQIVPIGINLWKPGTQGNGFFWRIRFGEIINFNKCVFCAA